MKKIVYYEIKVDADVPHIKHSFYSLSGACYEKLDDAIKRVEWAWQNFNLNNLIVVDELKQKCSDNSYYFFKVVLKSKDGNLIWFTILVKRHYLFIL